MSGGLNLCACRHPGHYDAWQRWWWKKKHSEGGLNCEGWGPLHTVVFVQGILKEVVGLIGLRGMLTY